MQPSDSTIQSALTFLNNAQTEIIKLKLFSEFPTSEISLLKKENFILKERISALEAEFLSKTSENSVLKERISDLEAESLAKTSTIQDIVLIASKHL